jgi:very-short-patch-repair endonuclease
MRGVERSETAPYVQHAKFAIEPCTMAREIPRSLLLRFAREQRAQAVQAEAIIWRAVRNRRREGAKFQRQVPLGDYIVDFICFEYRLAVEIDGPSHDVSQQRLADKERDTWLREQGFRILRLANELVIASTELAVARIRDALGN